MTEEGFRRLALALPEAVESAHMGTPDFRVRGRIFATLRDGRGVLKLKPEQREMLGQAEPARFGLAAADEVTTRSALTTAWRNVAPKRLAAALDAG